MSFWITVVQSCFILIFLIHHLSFPPPTSAFYLSEIHPAPSFGQEWIELHNPHPAPLDLSNWWLEDVLSSPSVIYTFPELTFLDPNQHLLIYLNAAKLNNSADGVMLKDASGQIIDSMQYESTQTDLSWSLFQNQFYLTAPTPGLANLAPAPSPSPTPSALPPSSPSPSSTPSPSPFPPSDTSFHHHIRITDFEPCPPSGEPEWIELTNYDSVSHLLTNWKIRDAANQTRLINFNLDANSPQRLSWSNSFLNNQEETFYLENELGHQLQTIHYTDCNLSTVENNDEEETNTSTNVNATAASNSSASTTPNPSVSPPTKLANTSTSFLKSHPYPSPSISLNQLTLGQLARHPPTNSAITFSNPAATTRPLLAALPYLSVILGGAILLGSGSWQLKILYQHRFHHS